MNIRLANRTDKKNVISLLDELILKVNKKMGSTKVYSGIELAEAHRFYEFHGGKFTEKLFRFDLKKL